MNFRVVGKTTKVSVPEGKSLYDFYELTYRNETLYRLNDYLLVGDENEDLESYNDFVYFEEEEEEEVTVLNVVEHSDKVHELKVDGVCECYDEDERMNDRRYMGNLLFSTRISSVVVVSFLGYVASKFVGDNIDDCYDHARGVLGDLPFTCSVSMNMWVWNDVEVAEALIDANRDTGEKREFVFDCEGYCVRLESEKETFSGSQNAS